ncbi:hypothetical protein DICPUDRAFT_151807 [Dictyostelium purpureum]|uniref:G-protein coupled receptors family 3 profile domain-containing protein n=1 Tax=Dictyostelium purpureum TaxID=5786 RepID=F0ZJS9_DICPU|nr:uncharacterized protein DICPUDRAFT_151807 [Dictyostelium purpureum]EGC35793.1 hypothetical protein DICPUDRAFT_151807 [Dictyostelium purpureum]|eukprot:XP_003287687.1 hypothetical protein DICPUDRAFT_151807 [Dictyostelium purpureum]
MRIIFKFIFVLFLLNLLFKGNYGIDKDYPPKNESEIVIGFVAPIGDIEFDQYITGAKYAFSKWEEAFNKRGKSIVLHRLAEDTNDILDSLSMVQYPVAGIIGPAYSGSSSTSCLVYGAFSVPSISFYATGTDLSNPSLYPYFNRVMPDDRLQVKAILSLVEKNGWTRISCVHTNEDYGNGGADQLVQQSNARGITVNTNQAITAIDGDDVPTKEEYDIVFDNLAAAKSRVIVLYAIFPKDCLGVWEKAKERGFMGKGFTWIVTDGCAELTNGYNESIVGVLATFPRYNADDNFNEFEQYIIKESGTTDGSFFKGASFSYDAAFAMLKAMDHALENGKDVWEGSDLLESIRTITFEGITGTISFDPTTGDRLHGVFSLLNLIDYNKGSFDIIGFIDPNNGTISLSQDILYSGPSYAVPSDYQVIVYDKTLNIVLGVITGVCILIVLFIGAVIVLQWRKFRYSSPLFCMFIIIGALLGLSSVFVLLPSPTVPLCSSFPWLLGLGYVILFGSLFTKTWRTWRLFSNARKFKVIRITNQYILTLVGGFILLESIFMILWTTIDRPIPLAEPIYKAGEAQLQCTSDSEAWWYVFVFYKVFYIFVGVFLAFKTRDVVDSLNESKPITLALYNLTFVMIVSIALGFILRDNPTAIIVIQIIAILLGFTVTVAVLFLPKVWKILSGQQHSVDSIGTSMDSMGRTTQDQSRGYTTQDYNNQSVGRSFSASAQGFNNVQPSNHPQLGIVYTGGEQFPRLSSLSLASKSEAEINVNSEVINKAKASENNKNNNNNDESQA